MPFNRDLDIEVLNSLIETTVDSVHGYRDGAEHTNDPGLKALFESRAAERERVLAELRAKVQELGGSAEDEGTMLARAHRVYVDLKSALGSDRKRVIEEVERGEDHIKGKFESALRNQQLSTDTLAVIRQCYSSVKAGHDQISAMKHGQDRR
jgi:uncharacterized protein (TIGR02284 family)